jgi:DNA-directed RNA polymerase subunit beta'
MLHDFFSFAELLIRRILLSELKETINYRTFKPEMDGLFCERIFGPVKSWECACGKYKRARYRQNNENALICSLCHVEVTESKVRRSRLGHIKLASPVTHVWFLKSIPSYMAVILNKSIKEIEKIVYYTGYLIMINKLSSVTFSGNDWNYHKWYYKNVHLDLTNNEMRHLYNEISGKLNLKDEKTFMLDNVIGAQAIHYLLSEIQLEHLAQNIKFDLKLLSKAREQDDLKNILQRRKKYVRRLRVVNQFLQTRSKPEWMVLTYLPVLPPDLRPMVQLDGGKFATSDLNDLYRRVINRNNRLHRLKKMLAPELLIRNEKRLLQESVDALIHNGRRGKAIIDKARRPLKSLSNIIEGKQGRFRQNLLGKRVDYSGRSVIVVGPYLKLYECGLPREMAIELFHPFVLHKLIQLRIAHNIRNAKIKIQNEEPIIWQLLDEVLKGHPILLNRAPTLHRLGIQAFQPKLVYGRALHLHPLVCSAFNADFDGDQMAVHIPISLESQAEARLMMFTLHNWISPATGSAIMLPSQDMVLGCYFMTIENVSLFYVLKNVLYFTDLQDVIQAYKQRLIDLHTFIWVRSSNLESKVFFEKQLATLKNGKVSLTMPFLSQENNDLNLLQYIRTTPGRILLNKVICNSL